MDTDPQWYALRVQPQKEYVAAYLLRKQGVRTFVPTETRFRRRTRYQKSKAEFAHPVIPGCVFAGFDGMPAWFFILRNPLIIGPESMDGHPWQMDIDKLFRFFGESVDGCMVLEDGLQLVHVQGRGVLRPATTRVKHISKKAADKAPVPTGRRKRILAQFAKGLEAQEQISDIVYSDDHLIRGQRVGAEPREARSAGYTDTQAA